jgi:hypothetical protein
MHAGFTAVAFNGDVHGFGSTGAEKRSGGDNAKGMPRYAFTSEARIMPSTGPEFMVTAGAFLAIPSANALAKKALLSKAGLNNIF